MEDGDEGERLVTLRLIKSEPERRRSIRRWSKPRRRKIMSASFRRPIQWGRGRPQERSRRDGSARYRSGSRRQRRGKSGGLPWRHLRRESIRKVREARSKEEHVRLFQESFETVYEVARQGMLRELMDEIANGHGPRPDLPLALETPAGMGLDEESRPLGLEELFSGDRATRSAASERVWPPLFSSCLDLAFLENPNGGTFLGGLWSRKQPVDSDPPGPKLSR